MRAVWRAIRGHLLSRLRVTEVKLVSFLSISLLLLLATVDSRRAPDAFPSLLLLLLVNPSLSLIGGHFLCGTFLLFVPTFPHKLLKYLL